MSDPSAEVRTGPSGMLLVVIAFGLMVLAAIAAFLLLGTGGPIDGRARMTAVFGTAELPFGLAIESGTEMSSGGSLVVYSIPGLAAEAPPPSVEKNASNDGAPRFDWSTVPVVDSNTPPRQAAFLFVSGEKGRSVIEEMIRNVRGRDRGELGSEGGTVVLERGRLDFRGFDSEWIHLRTYEPGPTFRDAMRISLSTPVDPCVLTVTWPRGNPASHAQLATLTAALRAGSG